MSADQVSTGVRCGCPHCTGQGEEDLIVSDRAYYVPDPPTIPLPPGSTATTAPPEEPGYTGPRFRTLMRGDDWNGVQVGVPVLVPYTFATRAMSNYATGDSAGQAGFELTSGQPLAENQKANIREALALWEQVSGLTFIEVPDTAAWEFSGIRFMMESIETEYVGGRAYTNPDPYGTNIVINRLFYGNQTLERGSEAFWVTLHEIGHGIGLKHPFDGDPILKASEDNNKNTVMAYVDKGNYSNLGPFDIAAAQFIYGTPEAEAASPIRWARGADGSLVTAGDASANRIGGLDIRDLVHGFGGDDLVATYGGEDIVLPGAGNDAVYGGAGVDTLVTGFLRKQAAVAVGAGKGTVSLPDGVDSFYEVEILRFTDGDHFLGADSAAGQAYRLYTAALGRAPDPIGLGHWVEALRSGAVSLPGAAADIAGSAEFAVRYGAPDAAGFVTLLYQNVLGRAPDAAGLSFWVNALHNPSVGRAGVLLGFSEAAENRTKTAAAFGNGIWVPDPQAVDALRAYVAVLDRLPDAQGLANWTAAREGGLASSDMIDRFVHSPEFGARFGGLSNRDFVEQLYRTALDRPADANGLAAWTAVLDAGVDSRSGVAFGFANSVEMAAKLTPLVQDGVLFA